LFPSNKTSSAKREAHECSDLLCRVHQSSFPTDDPASAVRCGAELPKRKRKPDRSGWWCNKYDDSCGHVKICYLLQSALFPIHGPFALSDSSDNSKFIPVGRYHLSSCRHNMVSKGASNSFWSKHCVGIHKRYIRTNMECRQNTSPLHINHAEIEFYSCKTLPWPDKSQSGPLRPVISSRCQTGDPIKTNPFQLLPVLASKHINPVPAPQHQLPPFPDHPTHRTPTRTRETADPETSCSRPPAQNLAPSNSTLYSCTVLQTR
jgi:hypothetical protein